PQVQVRVCRDPLLGGVNEALKWERIAPILDRYRGMFDAFLLVVDRDGMENRHRQLHSLEEQARQLLPPTGLFLAVQAFQEVEVWALAGMLDLPKSWRWAAIRSERDCKERFFLPYVQSRGLEWAPFGGRLDLGREAAGRYPRVRQLCPEDLGELEQRLRAQIS